MTKKEQTIRRLTNEIIIVIQQEGERMQKFQKESGLLEVVDFYNQFLNNIQSKLSEAYDLGAAFEKQRIEGALN